MRPAGLFFNPRNFVGWNVDKINKNIYYVSSSKTLDLRIPPHKNRRKRGKASLLVLLRSGVHLSRLNCKDAPANPPYYHRFFETSSANLDGNRVSQSLVAWHYQKGVTFTYPAVPELSSTGGFVFIIPKFRWLQFLPIFSYADSQFNMQAGSQARQANATQAGWGLKPMR